MSAWSKAWGLAWGNAWGILRGHQRACPERTYLIPADDRFYTVQEDRTYTVKGC